MSAPATTSAAPAPTPAPVGTSGPPAAPQAQAPAPTPAPPAPGAASAAPAPAPHASRAPRKIAVSLKASAPGAPHMLSEVRNLAMSTVQQRTNSYFVPHTLVMFQLLATMDQVIQHNYYFQRGQTNWHPFISQLYVTLLFFIHMIRVMAETQELPAHVQSFLTSFQNTIGFDALLVPGPLVPFFNCLTAFSGPEEWYGNVSPTLPNLVTDQWLRWRNNFFNMIPSALHILDQIRYLIDNDFTVANTTGTGILSSESAFRNHRYFTHIWQNAASVTLHGRTIMHSPNFRTTPRVTLGQAVKLATSWQEIDFPTRNDLTGYVAAVNDLGIEHFLGIFTFNGEYRQWLVPVCETMNYYCRFFDQSVSLSSLPLIGLGAGIPIFTPSTTSLFHDNAVTFVAAVANGPPAHYRPNSVVSFESKMEHNDRTLEELAEQYAMLGMVNVSYAHVPAGGITPPPLGNLRFGPVWTLPVIRRLSRLDTRPGQLLAVRSSYLLDRPF